MDPRDLEHLVARYDGAIRFVDSELARLVERLDELDLEENTLVVVTGDHGEEFYEHGMKTHRHQLFLESVSVPLILRWPAGLPSGKVVEGNTGLVDVVPTLLSAARLTPDAPTMGRDLIALAHGRGSGSAPSYLSELIAFDEGPVPLRLVGIASGDEHRILETQGRAPWSALDFDLARDPLGRGPGTTLTGEALARVEEELDRLRGILLRLREVQPLREVGRPLTQLEREDLAAMGYAGGEETIEGTAGEDRLSLDGGVWPDE